MIRPVTPADLPALRQMLQDLADHDGATYQVASVAALQEAAFGAVPQIHALIAPLGMVIYFPWYSTHRGLPGLFVQDLYVAPQARGSGLARALLAEAMQHQGWGARFIALAVNADNLAASRFYAKTGFTPQGYDMMILEGAALTDLAPKDPP
jgi:ribosomal protein S18 acetylase RimI-like enzyme